MTEERQLNTIGSERRERPSARVNALFELMDPFSLFNRKMVPPLTRKSGISIAIVGQCEVDTPTVQSIDRYRCRCSHSISSPFGSESLYLDNGIGTTERFVLVGAAVQEVF